RQAQAARMPRLWHALHAGTSIGRDDGFIGRRMCGVLPLPSDGGGTWLISPSVVRFLVLKRTPYCWRMAAAAGRCTVCLKRCFCPPFPILPSLPPTTARC